MDSKTASRKLRIPAEQVKDATRWDLPLMDADGNPLKRPGEAAEEEIQPPTAEELEEIRQLAYQDGFEQGRKEGFAQGQEEGSKSGHAEGLAQGKEDGWNQGQAELEATQARLQNVMQGLLEPIAQQEEQLEQALLHTALALARAVIMRETRMSDAVITDVIRDALKHLPDSRGEVTIYIHPQDLPFVEPIREPRWHLLTDPKLVPGGCRVESQSSVVDFTLEKRFQKTVQQMLDKHIAGAAEENPELTGHIEDLTDLHREILFSADGEADESSEQQGGDDESG